MKYSTLPPRLKWGLTHGCRGGGISILFKVQCIPSNGILAKFGVTGVGLCSPLVEIPTLPQEKGDHSHRCCDHSQDVVNWSRELKGYGQTTIYQIDQRSRMVS